MTRASQQVLRTRPLIGARPAADPASVWVQQADVPRMPSRASTYTARLTIDVTPAMRGRIKVFAFERGLTTADMLRELLESAFPEQAP